MYMYMVGIAEFQGFYVHSALLFCIFLNNESRWIFSVFVTDEGMMMMAAAAAATPGTKACRDNTKKRGNLDARSERWAMVEWWAVGRGLVEYLGSWLALWLAGCVIGSRKMPKPT